MASSLVGDFDIARYGFGFGNFFADRKFVIPTVLGDLRLLPTNGMCGGMTFAALDYYSTGRQAPDALSDPMWNFLCERQTDSLDLPVGLYRYLSWQSSSDASVKFRHWRIREGISYSTIVSEWPKIRGLLDNSRLAPLALIRTGSVDFRDVTLNHQVLAYGYDLDEDSQSLSIRVCDPNKPRDDSVTLEMNLGDPDAYHPVTLSSDPGTPVRGFFLSNYTTPKSPPDEI